MGEIQLTFHSLIQQGNTLNSVNISLIDMTRKILCIHQTHFTHMRRRAPAVMSAIIQASLQTDPSGEI